MSARRTRQVNSGVTDAAAQTPRAETDRRTGVSGHVPRNPGGPRRPHSVPDTTGRHREATKIQEAAGMSERAEQ